MEESFNWLKAIISTSWTPFHIECCQTLLKLFATKHIEDENFKSAYVELTNDLDDKTLSLNYLK